HTARLLHAALSNGWTFATSLPLLDNNGFCVEQALPTRYQSVLRDGHCILDSLRGLGEVPEHEHQRGLETMGLRHAIPSDQHIEKLSTILCRSYVLELLADTHLLTRAASIFHLTIDTYEFERTVTTQIASIAFAESVAAWLA